MICLANSKRERSRSLIPFVLLVFLLVCIAMAANADDKIADDIINATPGTTSQPVDLRQSLRSAPWFDTQNDSLRPIRVQPRSDDTQHRSSRWRPKAKKLKRPTKAAQPTAGGGTGTGIFGTGLSIGNVFGWVLLVTLVLMIVAAIIYAVSRAEIKLGHGSNGGNTSAKRTDLPDEATLERMKHLPPELRRTDVNLRSECERLMNENRFDQAIILLLGHQLLLLDQNGLLRLSRGKTNGRYVRETRGHDSSCGQWLRATTDAFEQSYFGRHEIPAEVFGELWRQNEHLERAAREFGGVH